MIILNETTLRQLQMIELEILVEVDRICRKNGIHYSLTGGTLLGAVRHGAFIPWDDDADISMLRKEYVKFQDACKRDLDKERFYFQDIENTPGYRWGYGKVRRKGTVFLRENQEDMPYEQGVFIDIFPRDGIPDGVFLRKFHAMCCFCLRKIMWASVGRRTASNKYERLVYVLLAKVPEKIMKKSYKFLVEISNKNENTQLVRALTFPLPNGQLGYKRLWYERYTEIEFEGRKFIVEAFYTEWLKSEFGNYMELPPYEKRKMHPGSKIKLTVMQNQEDI